MNRAAHGRRDDEALDRGDALKKQTRWNAQATRASAVPEICPITEEMRAWAQERVPSVNVARETEPFLDHHRAKGSGCKDGVAAWRTWMHRAVAFQEKGATARAWSSQADMHSARQRPFVQSPEEHYR
jgi:hypothetical protein